MALRPSRDIDSRHASCRVIFQGVDCHCFHKMLRATATLALVGSPADVPLVVARVLYAPVDFDFQWQSG